MSTLRPETVNSDKPCVPESTAYYMVCEAVARAKKGLIYGKLHDDKTGLHCALGQMWNASPQAIIPTKIVEEVAAINDMFNGKETPKQRQKRVLKWLRWKVRVLAGAKK
jgi:hypothetical protein